MLWIMKFAKNFVKSTNKWRSWFHEIFTEIPHFFEILLDDKNPRENDLPNLYQFDEIFHKFSYCDLVYVLGIIIEFLCMVSLLRAQREHSCFMWV